MAITVETLTARLGRANRGLLDAIEAYNGEGRAPLVLDAIEDALLRLGYAVATLGALADSDLTAIPDRKLPQLLALAGLLLHEAMLGSVVAIVTEYDGANRVEWSDMARSLEATVRREQADYDKRFAAAGVAGGGTGRVAAGSMVSGPIPPDGLSQLWNTP